MNIGIKVVNVVILIMFLFVVKIEAISYFISPTGSDVTGNGSNSSPWASLQKAFSSMSGGDALILMDGTYTGISNIINNEHIPPIGTAGAWTTIRAENVGMAVIDGENARNMFSISYPWHRSNYWHFDGIIWKNSSSSNVTMSGQKYVKFTHCGAYDSSDGNTVNFNISEKCNQILLENCYAWGNGRYKFLVYISSQCIIRQCVGRLDRTNANEPMAVFAVYSCDDVEVQNCIAIDSDQVDKYTGNDRGGAFYVPSTSIDANRVAFNSCIGLNIKCGGSGINGNQWNRSADVLFKNCIFWDMSTTPGSYLHNWRGLRVTGENCTFGISSYTYRGVGSWDEMPGGANNDTVLKNSIVYRFGTGPALYDIETEDYNCLYQNTSNYLNTIPGAHTLTNVNPVWSASNATGSLKYITRIEASTNLKGQGGSGADIGANCTTLVGVAGTLWGEPGYNTNTGTSMWPFPNEELIRSKMREYNNYSIAGNRGFCADGQTLTKYIWEYLGNSIPAEIYGTSNNPPTADASASPASGPQPLTVNFTGSGSDTDGTIASYSWNFGDGGTSAQQNPSHTYNNEGNYTATLTVTDNNGATGTASTPITVTAVYSISGVIRDSGGAGISGVTVTISGGVSGSTLTATNGSYQFPNLAGNVSYTVTAAKAGYNFAPVSLSTASLNTNWGNGNFIATPFYYIKGYVRTSGGAGISGVIMTLGGGASSTTVTATDGSYQFMDLAAGKNLTVTPVKPGFTFTPVSLSTASLNANWDNGNFTGTSLYYIKGFVRNSAGTGISGVAVALGGAVSSSTTTTTDGSYQFLDLREGSSYTVTPSKAGYAFMPLSVSTAALNANWDNNNFTGTARYYIKGYARTSGGTGISGVTVALSGTATQTVTTGIDGQYQFQDLAENGGYTVTPSKNGMLFSPASQSTASLKANWDNGNFTGTPLYHIKGFVRNTGGMGISGVAVTLSGNMSASMTTGTDGAYEFLNLPGNNAYTITPAKTGYTFTPVSLSTSSLSANWESRNFTGAVPSYYVRGFVRNGSGAGVGGVSVSLSGGLSRGTTTAADGSYQFLSLPGNTNYTLTPSKASSTFNPASIMITGLQADLDNQNFTVIPLYQIRGYVRKNGGAGINRVKVTLSGSRSGSYDTGDNGFYQFIDLPANGSYTITPSKEKFIFTPAFRSYASLPATMTGQNFTGKQIHNIRGIVRKTTGAGIAGAKVVLSGFLSKSALTDESGMYCFEEIEEEGEYSVTVTKEGCTFNPPVRSTFTLSGELEDWDFFAVFLDSLSEGEMKIVGSSAGRGTVNPDNNETAKIYFKGSDTGRFEVRIYTLEGEQLWEDSKDNVREGVFEWVPKDIASGTYIVYMKGPGIELRNKVVILR